MNRHRLRYTGACVVISVLATSACSADAPTIPIAITTPVKPETSVRTGTESKSSTLNSKVLPPYAFILECTGWAEYVDKNVDTVRFYNYETFDSDQGPAIGLSRYVQGLRIVDVAIKNRADVDIAATLVHEAAHLSGIRTLGVFLDEAAADGAAAGFLADAQGQSLDATRVPSNGHSGCSALRAGTSTRSMERGHQ